MKTAGTALVLFALTAAARRLYESCGFRLYGMEPMAIRKAEGDIGQAHYHLRLGKT
jgi:hypothetical protein